MPPCSLQLQRILVHQTISKLDRQSNLEKKRSLSPVSLVRYLVPCSLPRIFALLRGNHTFRATGVTAYLNNGSTLEKAARMANHASTRMTQLYDRRAEDVTLDEVKRVVI